MARTAIGQTIPMRTSCTRRACRERKRARGFSLIELVVVLVILALVAAIAVGRLGSSTAGTQETALRASLNVLRGAIDRYAAEHHGSWPGNKPNGRGDPANSRGALIDQLTLYSNADGKVSTARDAAHPFGPYLQRIPPLPVGRKAGSTGVAIDVTNSPPLVTLGSEGWVYNPNAGEIIANTDEPTSDGKMTFDEF